MNSLNKFLNKNGKILLSLMLTVVMLFSLSACGNDPELNLSTIDDASSNTTSMVFVDDDRVEDKLPYTTKDKYGVYELCNGDYQADVDHIVGYKYRSEQPVWVCQKVQYSLRTCTTTALQLLHIATREREEGDLRSRGHSRKQ